MTLSRDILPDLKWWATNISKSYNQIRSDKFDLEIYADGSLTGWGACCRNKKAHGWSDTTEQTNHINFLELLVIFNGLKSFASKHKARNILIHVHNTTALSYINRMGSIKYQKLDSLTREIWRWWEERDLWLHATYISSRENSEADRQSRILPPDTE